MAGARIHWVRNHLGVQTAKVESSGGTIIVSVWASDPFGAGWKWEVRFEGAAGPVDGGTINGATGRERAVTAIHRSLRRIAATLPTDPTAPANN